MSLTDDWKAEGLRKKKIILSKLYPMGKYIRRTCTTTTVSVFAEIELNIFLLRIQTSKCLLRVIIKNCIGLERKTSRCLTFWKWSQEGLRLVVIPKTLFG